MLPCLIFEDEHLLVVNKPAGLNTHSPATYAGEGLYDWLRHREPRWANLAIIHRLDKETSGVLLFSKTPVGNRALTDQFTRRLVRKKYLFLTDRPGPRQTLIARSALVRAGEKYLSRPLHAGGEVAETQFRPASPLGEDFGPHPGGAEVGSNRLEMIEAEPMTGRTHQIRVHAADQGFPVLGDTLYGGTPAARVCLHASELQLAHPVSGEKLTFRAPLSFGLGTASPAEDPRLRLRTALIDPEETNAFRLIHGASDGWADWYVDRLGDYYLSQGEAPVSEEQMAWLKQARQGTEAGRQSEGGVYHKRLVRQVRRTVPSGVSPQLVLGGPAPERFVVRENGLLFELSFQEGYSVGLFLDQRDNRRRLITGQVAAGFALAGPAVAEGSRPTLLNTFAYTCGFSVCAAQAGWHTTSLDLSKKYLDWGRRNFALNRLDPAAHDFIYGDAVDWLRRLARKRRRFDAIVLDPPTFSQSKESGVFRVEKDFGKLVTAALPLLQAGGVLLASTNAADWPPEAFLATLEAATLTARRPILQRHYVPQPPDFPITRAEPAYLKTVWLRVG